MARRNLQSQAHLSLEQGNRSVFWEVVSPRAVLGFWQVHQVSLFWRLTCQRECVFFGLCVFRKGFGRVFAFSKSRMRFSVFVFFQEGLRFWSLCFQEIDLHFVFVFSVFSQNPDFLPPAFSSLQQNDDQTDIRAKSAAFTDIVFRFHEVIHMFHPLRPAFCRLIRRTARAFPYTEFMSVGANPRDNQIRMTHGCVTAAGGRENSACGTSTERYCRKASAGRRGCAGFRWFHVRRLFAQDRRYCTESSARPSLPDSNGATAGAPSCGGRYRRAEGRCREGRLTC